MIEESDKSGHSTLFFVSKKHPIKKAELQKRIESGVSTSQVQNLLSAIMH